MISIFNFCKLFYRVFLKFLIPRPPVRSFCRKIYYTLYNLKYEKFWRKSVWSKKGYTWCRKKYGAHARLMFFLSNKSQIGPLRPCITLSVAGCSFFTAQQPAFQIPRFIKTIFYSRTKPSKKPESNLLKFFKNNNNGETRLQKGRRVEKKKRRRRNQFATNYFTSSEHRRAVTPFYNPVPVHNETPLACMRPVSNPSTPAASSSSPSSYFFYFLFFPFFPLRSLTLLLDRVWFVSRECCGLKTPPEKNSRNKKSSWAEDLELTSSWTVKGKFCWVLLWWAWELFF